MKLNSVALSILCFITINFSHNVSAQQVGKDQIKLLMQASRAETINYLPRIRKLYDEAIAGSLEAVSISAIMDAQQTLNSSYYAFSMLIDFYEPTLHDKRLALNYLDFFGIGLDQEALNRIEYLPINIELKTLSIDLKESLLYHRLTARRIRSYINQQQ